MGRGSPPTEGKVLRHNQIFFTILSGNGTNNPFLRDFTVHFNVTTEQERNWCEWRPGPSGTSDVRAKNRNVPPKAGRVATLLVELNWDWAGSV